MAALQRRRLVGTSCPTRRTARPPRRAEPGPALPATIRCAAVPPRVYVQALTGQRCRPRRQGRCPFHDDHTPSLHVYGRPERGWYCFGCGRGGSIFDLAAELYGLSTRGREFVELRRRLLRRARGMGARAAGSEAAG